MARSKVRKAKMASPEKVAVTKPVQAKGQPAQQVTVVAVRNEGSWAKRTWLRLTSKRDESMREQMAAVKAGVLHELETLSAEKGVALTGGPFRNVVLPQIRKKNPWMWPLVAATVLVLVVLMVLVGRGPATPDDVLHQTMVAMSNHDVAAFEKHVDVAAVASSVVNQVFSFPQVKAGALSPEVQQQLQGGMGARMTAFIKPGLAENLRDEVLQAVKDGKISSENDKSFLLRIWQDFGGENVKLGQIRVAMQDADMAVAEVPVERTDLGLTLPLQVVLNRGTKGHEEWQVADIPNFGAVLETLAGAASKRAQRDESRAASQMDGKVAVSDVRKAKAATDGILLTMVVVNTSGEVLHDVKFKVSFGDAAGQPLKEAELTLDNALQAHESREQTWTVPVDASHAAERYVLDLPLSALSVKVVPVSGAL